MIDFSLLPVYHALSMQVCGTEKKKGRLVVSVRGVGAFESCIPIRPQWSRAHRPIHVVLLQLPATGANQRLNLVLRLHLARPEPANRSEGV